MELENLLVLNLSEKSTKNKGEKMNEFVKLSERFPEENDLVYFHDGNGDIYRGFYILPYRSYPNSYFDPYKFAKWCVISGYGNWEETSIMPVDWSFICKTGTPEGDRIMCGYYIKKGY